MAYSDADIIRNLHDIFSTLSDDMDLIDADNRMVEHLGCCDELDEYLERRAVASYWLSVAWRRVYGQRKSTEAA